MALLVELYTAGRPRDGIGYTVEGPSVERALDQACQEALRRGDFKEAQLPQLGVVVDGPNGVLLRTSPRL